MAHRSVARTRSHPRVSSPERLGQATSEPTVRQIAIRIVRLSLYAIFTLGAPAIQGVAAADVVRPPMTSADAVETTRFMSTGVKGEALVSISPDGRRYVVRLARGDRRKNGVWVDVLSGALDSIGSATPSVAAHLFSTGRGVPGYGGGAADASGDRSPIKWVDNQTVAFLFTDKREMRQVLTVDLKRKRASFRTHHPTQIQTFDIAPNGSIVYLATLGESRKSQAPPGGFVVPRSANLLSMVSGYFDGSTADSRASDSAWFVQSPHGKAERVLVGGQMIDVGFPQFQFASLSPDGSKAILKSAAVKPIPAEWDEYAGRIVGFDAVSQQRLVAARVDPSGVDVRGIMQLYVLDLGSKSVRPLWQAMAPTGRPFVSWAPDSDFVMISPTPLPITSRSDAITDGSTVIFDTRNQAHWRVPVDGLAIQRITWRGPRKAEIESDVSGGIVRSCVGFEGGDWQVSRECGRERTLKSGVAVEIRQDLNTPPRLFVTEVGGPPARVVLDPNPGFTSKYSLGVVKYLQGVLSTGEHWDGLLTFPVRYEKGKRYPLVLQSQGGSVSANEFTLYGYSSDGWGGDAGLAPSAIAPYAAQMLAGRGIAVLEFDVTAKWGSPAEAETTQRGFEELARKLIDDQLADDQRVGISGFSRNGYFAYHALSHPHFPFAAAVVADNFDASYMQTVLGDNYTDAEAAIGAPASGTGLRTWLERATGFNADAIRAPLLLIGQSSGAVENILQQWEILGRLRRLHRSVEMYIMPGIDAHPSHNPQNPGQVIAVQERAVDWFDFWLNGHEDSDPEKAGQYVRWEKLCDLQIDNSPDYPASCARSKTH